MKLFVGLGNPGGRYAANRHNIGFMAIDRIAQAHGFPPFRAKFNGETSEGRLGAQRVVLLKPQTFMNLSGQSVGEAARFHKIAPEDIVVFHDELDLAPGRVRTKAGGGHAGHNGLRSIHQHLGESYARVRLGIGHPGHKDRVAGYVLSDFAKGEADWLEAVLRGVCEGAPALAAGQDAAFLNTVSLRTAPPRSGTGQGAGQKAGQNAGQGAGQSAGNARGPGREQDAPGAPAPAAPAAPKAPTPDAQTAKPQPPEPQTPASPLARLAEKFRK